MIALGQHTHKTEGEERSHWESKCAILYFPNVNEAVGCRVLIFKEDMVLYSVFQQQLLYAWIIFYGPHNVTISNPKNEGKKASDMTNCYFIQCSTVQSHSARQPILSTMFTRPRQKDCPVRLSSHTLLNNVYDLLPNH